MLFLLLQRAALQRAPRVLIQKSRISKICKTEEAVKHRYDMYKNSISDIWGILYKLDINELSKSAMLLSITAGT